MKKHMTVILALLAVITLAVVIAHLEHNTRTEDLILISGGTETPVSLPELDAQTFSGTLVNGKGDVTESCYRGIELKTLLAEKGISLAGHETVTVTSADQYTATFTAEEILSDGKVYLAIRVDDVPVPGIEQDQPGAQLVVFGDENSRRCVRYAQVIEIVP